jgi:hypothetical protein
MFAGAATAFHQPVSLLTCLPALPRQAHRSDSNPDRIARQLRGPRASQQPGNVLRTLRCHASGKSIRENIALRDSFRSPFSEYKRGT